MQRSLYPSGVIVESDNLQFTESSKISAILSRLIATDTTGVVSGCLVAVNPVNTTNINVAAGTGYAPNGEAVTIPAAVNNLVLASYTVGILNYVVAVYTETYDDPQPHETNGNSYPTEANPSVRVRIYTQTQFNALPSTDANTSNDAQDRALLLGIVTAQGIGVPIPTTAVVNATAVGGALQVTNLTNTVTGVSILTLDRTTPSGNGTLTFTFVSGASTLAWTAPGDTTPGTPVTILNSGSYTLTALSGHTLSVLVVFPNLPASSMSDTIQITNLYSQAVPTFTANDILHRSYIGSGVPTRANPHGLTLADLGITTDPTQTHQEIFHANGVVRGSSTSIFTCTPQTAPSPDTITLTAPASGDSFYLGGVEYVGIASVTVTFTDVTNNSLSMFEVYLTEGSNTIANVQKFERVRFASTGTPLQGVVQLAGLHRGVIAGSGTITYTASGHLLAWTPPSGTIGSAIAVPSVASTIRLYDGTYSTYIELFVNAASTWSSFSSNLTDTLTVFALPTSLNTKLLIANAAFSGSSTGFVGNGFGTANSPNTIYNNRNIFGTESYNEISDNTGTFMMGNVDNGHLWFINHRVLFTDNVNGLTIDNGYQVNIDVTTNHKFLQIRDGSAGLPSGTPEQLWGLLVESGALVLQANTSINGDFSTAHDVFIAFPGTTQNDLFTDFNIIPQNSNALSRNLGETSSPWNTVYTNNLSSASTMTVTAPDLIINSPVGVNDLLSATDFIAQNVAPANGVVGMYKDTRVLGIGSVDWSASGGTAISSTWGIAAGATITIINATSGGHVQVMFTSLNFMSSGPAVIMITTSAAGAAGSPNPPYGFGATTVYPTNSDPTDQNHITYFNGAEVGVITSSGTAGGNILTAGCKGFVVTWKDDSNASSIAPFSFVIIGNN